MSKLMMMVRAWTCGACGRPMTSRYCSFCGGD